MKQYFFAAFNNQSTTLFQHCLSKAKYNYTLNFLIDLPSSSRTQHLLDRKGMPQKHNDLSHSSKEADLYVDSGNVNYALHVSVSSLKQTQN